MDSHIDPVDELNNLVLDTERVLKYIERFANEFYLPALNEWRYAAGHLTRYLLAERQGKDSDELRKAIAHLRRAYDDAVLLLMESFADSAYVFCKRTWRLARHKFIRQIGQDRVRDTLEEVLTVRQKIGMASLDGIELTLADLRAIVDRIVSSYEVIDSYMPMLRLYEHRVARWRILSTIANIVVGTVCGLLIWWVGEYLW